MFLNEGTRKSNLTAKTTGLVGCFLMQSFLVFGDVGLRMRPTPVRYQIDQDITKE